jgi:hypothetical protein
VSVPKEVILDLLPIYLAGEASPATRAWLEEELARDPELADRIRRQGLESFNFASLPPVPPDLELRTLHRTRRMMARLRWLFGVGMGFSALALALGISLHPVKIHLLLLDHPAQLGPCLAIAVGCWTAYFLLRRRLRIASR